MNIFKTLFSISTIFMITHHAFGRTLGDVILRGKDGLYMATSILEFDSVAKNQAGNSSDYIFDSFHINQIQIRKGFPARVFFALKDIMPPCLFLHAPCYPPSDEIIKINSLKILFEVLGHTNEKKGNTLYWSFFKISGIRIHLIHVEVSQGGGDTIDGMSIYECSEINTMSFE